MKKPLRAKFWHAWDRIRRTMGLLFILLPMLMASRVVHGVGGRGLWLVAERDGQLQDNGAVFANFISSSKKGIKLVVAVDFRQSCRSEWPLWEHVETIRYGSLKHNWYYAKSSVAISTHVFGASPYMGATRFLKPFRKGRVDAMVSHGVKKDHHSLYAKRSTRLDLLTCCTREEYQYYQNNCEYEDGELVLTGLCRFDELQPKVQPKVDSETNQFSSTDEFRYSILYTPTFRRTLVRPRGTHVPFESEDPLLFEIEAILSSRKLNELLRESNSRLVYRPHPRMEVYLDKFKTFSSTHVQVSTPEDCLLSTLIKQCDALITDYSSVAFDFAYQSKPVIYLQTDMDSYRRNHYKQGYFDYASDGFGPVFVSINDMLMYLDELIKRDLRPVRLYENRAEQTFHFRDQLNCSRAYDAILSHPILSRH